ncbi:MAG: ChrR family anti-sigma-E factor [Geminicoccaceae bacterium]
MNRIAHHGSATLLDDLSTGVLPEPLAVVARAHVELCGRCARKYRIAEERAASILDHLGPTTIDDDGLDRCLAQLDGRERLAALPDSEPASHADAGLPRAVRDLAPDGLDRLRWDWRGPARIARLMRGRDDFDLRLLWIREGAAMPGHRHEGTEATLVLRGSFNDGGSSFCRGDLALCNEDIAHAPRAGADEPCLCLVASSGPLVMNGPFGRILGRMLW